MKKKIWLFVIIILAAFGVFSIIRVITYEPIITYEPMIRVADIDEITVAALALWFKQQYPADDVNLPTGAINTQVFEGLTNLDENFKLEPRLAKSWDNPDDLTWRFHLREGVTFHDGSKFTANDVKFTIDETIKKSFYGQSFLSSVESVKIVDDYTIEIKTKEPDSILANKLSFVWVFNKNYLKEDGTINSIGTGPYELEEWDENNQYVILESNENYWGDVAKVKKVTWKSFGTDEERLKAVEDGEADLAYLIEGAEYVDKGRENGKVDILTGSGIYIMFIGFDVANEISPYVYGLDTNPFKDIRVRKAIYQGINVNQVMEEAFGGLAEVQDGVVTKDIFGYNPEIKRYPYDPEASKKLLQEAGYPDGFEINLDLDSAYDMYIAEPIAKSLEEIGIKVNATSRSETYDAWSNGDTSLYAGWMNTDIGDAIQALVHFFHTPDADDYTMRTFGMYNVGRYSDPELDELIDKANVTMNPRERLVYMQQALKMIHEDVAAIPLFTSEMGYAVNPNILFNPRPDDNIRAYEIAKKEIEYQAIEEEKSTWAIIFGF
jgi:peptide/nickel transport system substrate-binding protein